MSAAQVAGSVLEVAPHQWWLGWLDGPLVVEVRRIESYVDKAGLMWAVVEGWRRLPNGGRRWSRDLVNLAALPAKLRTDAFSRPASVARGTAA